MSEYCYPCGRWFASEYALQQHCDYSSAHARYESSEPESEPETFDCETCSRSFWSQGAANQHMNDRSHWAPTFECDTCTRTFTTERAAEQHMDALGHWEHYCKSCDRKFDNANNLKMHLNSRIHVGKSVLCPFCRKSYATASGLSHHLERGSCENAPFLNRQSIHQFAQRNDRNGVITKRLLTYPAFEATNRTWNGRGYECYLCHREYNNLAALNQHVQNGHQEKLYHCMKRACGREFVSLAGFFQHLESESCGVMRFGQVQRSAVEMLRTGRLIGS